MDILILTRDVTRNECPWLLRDIKEGESFYRYDNHTYGCIAPTGVAVTAKGCTPFFELPADALKQE